jgi:hypothetical protein
VDGALEADPFRRSESREGDLRISFSNPLAIIFEVDPKQKIVWILHVWRFKQRGARRYELCKLTDTIPKVKLEPIPLSQGPDFESGTSAIYVVLETRCGDT